MQRRVPKQFPKNFPLTYSLFPPKERKHAISDVADLQDLDDKQDDQISETLSEHSENQTFDGAETESFLSSVWSNPQTTRPCEIHAGTNMEISELKKKVSHLEVNMGTLLRKYNVLENEIARMKNESPNAEFNVLKSIHMLKAFQNGATKYDLELERKKNVTMMEGGWSFEYTQIEADPFVPALSRSMIKLSGTFEKATFQAMSITKKGKELPTSQLTLFNQGIGITIPFAKHHQSKKIKLLISLI